MATTKQIPDLADPRYLDEIGWFVCHQKHTYEGTDLSYAEQRVENSRIQLQAFLALAGVDESWLRNKSVVSVGSGCTGDLSAWPAEHKIAVDPLMLTYQRLGMLIDDAHGSQTEFITAGGESMPLLDACADVVYCRNALNHMPDPKAALGEFERILKPDGVFYLDVDIGGIPTPDEPIVFTAGGLLALLEQRFEVRTLREPTSPHSSHSPERREILLGHTADYRPAQLDRDALLAEYLRQFEA